MLPLIAWLYAPVCSAVRSVDARTVLLQFGLARSFISDPRKMIDQFAIPFKFALQRTEPVSQDMLNDALVGFYVTRVTLILQVFMGVGEENISNHLRRYALECVPDQRLRDMVSERLYSSPPSTEIQ